MGKTKTEFKWYTIPEYRKEEEYLSSMHRQGWKFTKVTFPGFYHFENLETGMENPVIGIIANSENQTNSVKALKYLAK